MLKKLSIILKHCAFALNVPNPYTSQHEKRSSLSHVGSYKIHSAGGLGFKRDDIATVLEKNLPVMNEKGMIFGYGINHEATAWNIRQVNLNLPPFKPSQLIMYRNLGLSLSSKNSMTHQTF